MLEDAFKQYGPIAECRIATNREDGKFQHVCRNPEKTKEKPENPLSSLYLLILSFLLILYRHRFQPRLRFHHIRRQGC
jgi:hypothetical protein